MFEDLTVRDVMTHDYVGVSESDTVEEIGRLMIEEGESAVAVVRGAEPIGTVMPRTMISACIGGADPSEKPIGDVMERPPRSVEPDLSLAQAAAILADVDTDHLFVSAGDEILGVLSENDLVTAMTSMLTTEPGETFDDDYGIAISAEAEQIGEMSAQSVCEVCGTLKTDLENINGQLVCDDCRSV